MSDRYKELIERADHYMELAEKAGPEQAKEYRTLAHVIMDKAWVLRNGHPVEMGVIHV